MSARYPYSRNRQYVPAPEFPSLTVAEVRQVERDKLLTELVREVSKIPTTRRDRNSIYDKQRAAEDFKSDVLALLRESGDPR